MTNNFLIVDDDDSMLETLASAFDHFGYNYVTINNTKDAIAVINGSPSKFSIMLTDVNFENGDMDGISLVSKVKSINKKIICIAMTGYMNQYSLDFCFSTGIRDIILKPFSIGDLKKVIDYNIYYQKRLYEYRGANGTR